MDLPLYPCASHALGYTTRVPVDVADTAGLPDTPTPVPVTLSADPQTGGWLVSWEKGVLGTVSSAWRARFPDMERVTGSGFAALTVAALRPRPEVLLAPPELAVPRNSVADNIPVLPQGEMFMVDTSTGEIGAQDLELLSPSQWLAALVEVGGEITATVDGRVIGTVAGGRSGEVRAMIEAARTAAGLPVVARAFVVDKLVALDCSAPDDADNPVSSVPPLRVPDTRRTRVMDATIAADGTLVVTVHRIAAADPADWTTGSARVTSPVERTEDDGPELPVPAAPEPDLAPQEDLPATGAEDERLLSHVEQVRLRRARRANDGSPRHQRNDISFDEQLRQARDNDDAAGRHQA